MFSQKITIKLEDTEGSEFIDDPGETAVRFEADMTDCSVHAWFKLFERILRVQGFNDEQIMRGATGLAFDEFRAPEVMKAVATDYGLILEEDEDVIIIKNDLEDLVSEKATD